MSCSSPCANRERRRWLRGLAGAALCLPALAVGANTLASPLPSEIAGSLPQARRLGRGTFRWWGLSIYDAELWSDRALSPERFEQSPFALALHYHRALVGQQIAERSLTEMRRIGPVDEQQGRRWLSAMREAFPNVQDGDRLVGLHRPGEATQFFCNGRPTHAIDDAAFAPLFFGIWLSPRSSEPALRAALYGQAR